MGEDELIALAKRVEALAGPDLGLDAEIVCALDLKPQWLSSQEGRLWVDRSGARPVVRFTYGAARKSRGDPPIDDVLHYTGSMDAAMTLVPSAWQWAVTDYQGCAPATAILGDKLIIRNAATPALALCAASLRARAEMEGE